jgi:hypothetical protein
MKTRHIAALAAAGAALIVVPVATPAAAASSLGSNIGCETTGATGAISGDWTSANSIANLVLLARDTRADGYAPAVALVTKRSDGSWKTWQFHLNLQGYGTVQTWDSSATDTAGIVAAYADVRNMSGSTVEYECASPISYNPYA